MKSDIRLELICLMPDPTRTYKNFDILTLWKCINRRKMNNPLAIITNIPYGSSRVSQYILRYERLHTHNKSKR